MNGASPEVRAAQLLRAFFERHDAARDAQTASAGSVTEPPVKVNAEPAMRHVPWPLPWQSAGRSMMFGRDCVHY